MLLRLRKTLSLRLYISSLSNSIVSSYMQILMMIPYKLNETLINIIFVIILDGLSWLRSEKLEVVLERLNFLQIRSINIGETRKLLVDHNVGVLVVHKMESPRLIVRHLKKSSVQLLFRNFHGATFRSLFGLLASVSVLLVCGC